MSMTGSLLLAALKLILTFLKMAQQRDLIRAGEDKAIAKASMAVLDATEHGQRLRNLLTVYSDKEAEDLWDRMLDVQ